MKPLTEGDSIGVIGAGSWGTALALAAAREGTPVKLWGHNAAALESMATQRENQRYLPGFPFPDTLTVEPDLNLLATTLDRFLIVVPSHAFATVLGMIAERRKEHSAGLPARIAWGTKGFEPGTGRFMSEVVAEKFHGQAEGVVVSGPSFAGEVAAGQPTALTCASDVQEAAQDVSAWIRGERMRVYTSDDVAGVQLGGAVKNIMAIATGICDGLGFGANTRAALITRGLKEISRLGQILGGRESTFMGLTGMGDLILTCTDDQSRNRRVGLGLGRGKILSEVLNEIGQEAEGIATTREVMSLAQRHQVEMPIVREVNEVLFNDKPPVAAVESLLSREPRQE